MAARFKTAETLGITQKQKDALVKTLRLLEGGKAKHVDPPPIAIDCERKRRYSFDGLFNMRVWKKKTDCGTVACIGGTAELVGGVKFTDVTMNDNLELAKLFYPHSGGLPFSAITVKQAAKALRNYLAVGAPLWEKVLRSAVKRAKDREVAPTRF
ncbi:hypothetical protein [Bradyrhizobium cenepequi]|uniref:hypothetical protein n=1 Tax=Bradyrhizobium cenepequi TaxID=2821403 RepID=UPI001CE2E5AE|nr:hypothetical protein [Bradyrhizobium cenepequi]MCA6108162.1 hypothetical protein [Bradyrhizobium cenepequi]